MPIALSAPSRLCPRNGLEYVKVHSPQLLAAARPSRHRPQHVRPTVRPPKGPKSEAVYGKFVYVRKLEQNVDFLYNDDPYQNKTQPMSSTASARVCLPNFDACSLYMTVAVVINEPAQGLMQSGMHTICVAR